MIDPSNASHQDARIDFQVAVTLGGISAATMLPNPAKDSGALFRPVTYPTQVLAAIQGKTI